MVSNRSLWSVFVATWTFVALSSSNAASFTPFQPPSYPLAVRSPYLSAWLPGNLANSLPSSAPQFWSGNDLAWSVIVRVDGVAYNVFGVTDALDGTQQAALTDATFTSTHSTFTLTAGDGTVKLDFFSPVSPKNYLRQSLPFSYLTVTVSGTSGNVQVYSDIDDTWTGQSSASSWSYSTNGTTGVYQITPANPITYAESANEQALWGEAVYATRPSDGGTLTSASGPPSTVRSEFVSNGKLSNSYPGWTSGGVVGFAHDLGTISGSSAVTFAIGHVREEAINYLGAAQTGYYRASYPETVAAVTYFLDDYSDAASESTTFDNLIQSSGNSAYGSNYSDILALSVRQTFGGIELTIPNQSLDTSDVQAFLKEISSDGNIQTVDVIYATFPIFYVLNPDFIRLLLQPVFTYLDQGSYTEAYAPHDLGAHYPNATGWDSSTEEAMPVEESGNVILLTYAYQSASNQTDLATTYSSYLQKYAQYLNENGEYPAAQYSLNDALGKLANQTNLGVKAAVALGAYNKLFSSSTQYTSAATTFADNIYTNRLGTNSGGNYYTLQYGVEPWFLVFNNYPDILFDLGIFPQESYNATSDFYPTVRSTAGIPLDGSLQWGQTNWQAWVAAISGSSTQEVFISDLHAYISNGLNTAPFSDRYWVEDSGEYTAGQSYTFRARPTLGSHFALLALKGANIWS
ncbi:hypothetical protein DTO212C5_5723 [Paecilomyces variotii]|nr:hypothetical protein DTO212C5_5723 [Paecilomyces variotii]KAJ9407684.1 hypothetical protein DTO045G8_4696 [Paecilomyces variotii]